MTDSIFYDPKKVALIVVDMQVDFYAPNGGAVERGKQVGQMKATASKIDQFVKVVHNKIGLTVFTKYLSGEGITPANLQKVADKENYSLMCEKGSGLEEISGIEVPQDAVVIEKPHYDAFAYTDLLTMLKNKEIKTVLITGVRTEVCVDATAKRAVSEGFDTIIIDDLVATYNDKGQLHKDILAFFDKYYGFVMSSLEVKKELKV